MNKTITPTKNESGLPLVAVHDVKGWCEYEPSYDGVVTHINTAGARLFGFNSPDDVILLTTRRHCPCYSGTDTYMVFTR